MEFLRSLDKQDERYKEIDEVSDLLKKGCSRGDKIPRDRWPRKYVREYQIHTLFRYELRSGWRHIHGFWYQIRENLHNFRGFWS